VKRPFVTRIADMLDMRSEIESYLLHVGPVGCAFEGPLLSSISDGALRHPSNWYAVVAMHVLRVSQSGPATRAASASVRARPLSPLMATSIPTVNQMLPTPWLATSIVCPHDQFGHIGGCEAYETIQPQISLSIE